MSSNLQSEISNLQSTRRAYFGADYGSIDTPVVTRADIDGSARGPLLIDEYDSTTVIPPGWSVRRDGEGNLVLEVVSQEPAAGY